jgi:hypothetical protein
MGVRMDGPVRAGQRSLPMDPPHGASQIRDTKDDEHHGDGHFHSESNSCRDGPLEENDRAADEENRQRVTNSPGGTYEGRTPNASLSRDNGRHGNDVIGVSRVTHTEHEAEAEDGKETCH